jgi:2',3'-cyclic-nucleotide 3'-phosphodiesterase
MRSFATNTTLGVALWLCPKPSSQIHETLNSLSRGLDPLFNDSARAEPHITITSQLAVNSQADVHTVLESAVAALGHTIDLHIKLTSLNINQKNHYFKKIYFGVEKTKNLVSFSTILREIYVEIPIRKNEAEAKYAAQDWARDSFDPHLSLIYTDMNHFDNALQKTITTRVEDYLGTGNIAVNSPDELDEYGLGWHGGVLKVINCEGPVREWQVLGTADIH